MEFYSIPAHDKANGKSFLKAGAVQELFAEVTRSEEVGGPTSQFIDTSCVQ